MRDSLLPILRCPFCASRFDFDERPQPALGRAEFGLLKCGCSVFPVIDGIPIIQRAPVCMMEHIRGAPETEGIAIASLVELIERGESLDALLECVAVPEMPELWKSLLGWRISHSRAAVRVARSRCKKKFLQKVLASRDTLGARDVLEFYYLSGGPLDPAMGHYFIRRFGQPRHLAALAMAATIASESKPILDIACGIGTLEHYFASRADPASVVGLDMNFYHLWIARHWMAPAGSYVCANADDGLPFADSCFGSTACSDAYHLIGNYSRLLQEIDRCAPNRMVVVTRAGNASAMPNEGVERTLERYVWEIGKPVRVFDEAELVRRYLRRIDVFAPPAKSQNELAELKWLSFAWNVPEGNVRTIDSDLIAPHAVGALGINPIYAQAPVGGGGVQLRFQFPIVWYAYENNAMLSYHPRLVSLTQDQVAGLARWEHDAALRRLVDSFVLIGLPHRFFARAPVNTP